MLRADRDERAARVEAALARGIYPILSPLPSGGALTPSDLPAAARTLAELGLGILQLRLKHLDDRAAFDVLVAVSDALVASAWVGVLVVDDRADLAALAKLHAPGAPLVIGVHVGQTDLPPVAVRAIVGPEAIIGASTHTQAQLEAALADEAVDVIGFGPIFATQSKADTAPTVGLAGLAEAARLVRAAPRPRPLVAIGGITHAHVNDVHAHGASAAAIIGDLAADGLPALAARAARLVEAWG